MSEAGVFEAAQGPAPEGAPKPFDPSVLSGFRAAGPVAVTLLRSQVFPKVIYLE